MADTTPYPTPATSNNWSPIERFKPEFFEDQIDFLVWLIDEEGNGFMNIAQYSPVDMVDMDAYTDGEYSGEYHITGEWRHTDGLEKLEPVAFRPMLEGPDLDALKRIVEIHGMAD